jgi:hypothetical protein
VKVKIGKPVNWIGPYQIAEMLMFWVDKNDHKDDRAHNFGKWLATNKKGEDSWLSRVCQWIHNKKKQKVNLKVDPWDIWGVDDTLSMVILPILLAYRERINGGPSVDDSDVPESLRANLKEGKDIIDTPDENWHARWEWVVDEIIWTFQQLQPDYDWEEQYCSGEIDIVWEPVTMETKEEQFFKMCKGPNDTYTADYDAIKKHQERINNGLRLFGKYYQGLWT